MVLSGGCLLACSDSGSSSGASGSSGTSAIAAPLLRKISPAFACPVRKGTPEQIDRGSALASAAIRDSASAVAPVPVRPALGFELDQTRKSDVAAWASRPKVSCANIGGNDNLQKCTDVSAAAVGESDNLGALEEVCFEFRSSGELVHVQTLRRHLPPSAAAHAAERLERNAAFALGEPSTVGGEPTPAHLGRGFLSSYVAIHAFKDYRATVSATNLAPTGLMVREEYLSAR